jgi:DUF177 domain-containing protein
VPAIAMSRGSAEPNECRAGDASIGFTGGRYPPAMTAIDLRRLRLRPGEVRRERVEVELDPFLLGGQRYEASPLTIPAELEITRASGALVFDLGLHARLVGPCMRCLGFAELELDTRARELHDPDAPVEDALRSEYVVDGRLQVDAWSRDAAALELPDQILCRPECAGLCPRCGKDLNVDPHEHADLEPDPRWAALEELRDRL